jgi:hypothetical protein
MLMRMLNIGHEGVEWIRLLMNWTEAGSRAPGHIALGLTRVGEFLDQLLLASKGRRRTRWN